MNQSSIIFLGPLVWLLCPPKEAAKDISTSMPLNQMRNYFT